MANGTITGQEVLKGVKEEIAATDASLKKLLATYNDLAAAIQNTTTARGTNGNTTQLNKADKESVDLLRKKAQLRRDEANALAAQSRAEKAAIQTKNAIANSQKKVAGATRTNLAQFKSLNSAYQQQSRLLNNLRQRYKDLAVLKLRDGRLTKSQENEYRRLSRRIRTLDRDLKRVDAATGQFQRNVGNYPRVVGAAARSLRAFAGAFGFTSGIFLLAGALRNTIGTFKQFDQSQADLAAILGRNKKEIGDLTLQAKELGATTAFTATQVSQLQLELAKLGFTDDQILRAAEGVENLAIATGVDAARAAKLAGAALRGFALDAEEANRVAAVLAVSTTKSASSFETLETALPKVSAIAKSFGFTIEDTTALLGGLQNAGFEASIAGTSLRQIFLQLADSNGKLAKRLGGSAKSFDELVEQFKRLESEGIDLGEAFELTNARSVAAFKVFLQGADDLKVLRDSIVDVEDELAELADTKLDSLAGDITLLGSAWEGFVLSIEDGQGAISNFFRVATQGLTEFLNGLTEANETPLTLGTKAAKDIVNDFKQGTDALTKESKDFILETIQDADKNISELQDRLNETLDRGAFLEIQNGTLIGEKDVLAQIRADLEKEKATRNELTKLLVKEGRIKDDLVERTARLAAIANAEKGNEINLENQIISFRKLSTAELNKLNAEYSNYIENLKATGNNSDAVRSLNTLRLQLKALKEEFNESEIESESFFDLDRQIKALEAEIARLTGTTKKTKRKREIPLKLTLKGGTKDLEKEVQDEIKRIEEILEGTVINVSDLNPEGTTISFKLEIPEDQFEAMQDDLEAIGAKAEETANRLKKAFEDSNFSIQETQEVFAQVFQSFGEYYGLDFSLFEDLIDKKSALEINYADTLKSVSDALFQEKFIKYDEELQANQERVNNLLEMEGLSEDQKKQIRDKGDQEQRRIRREQAQAEKDAALIRIAIDTAQAIVKAVAASPTTGGLPFSAIVAGIGAVQASIVASQRLPAFFKGKGEGDNYQGPATVNELPGQREIKIDKYGGTTLMKAGMHIEHIDKDDLIIPSISRFKKELKLPNSDVSRRFAQNITRDTEQRNRIVMVNNSSITTDQLEKVIRTETRKQTSALKGALKIRANRIQHSSRF